MAYQCNAEYPRAFEVGRHRVCNAGVRSRIRTRRRDASRQTKSTGCMRWASEGAQMEAH
jgi:hypothetical protein